MNDPNRIPLIVREIPLDGILRVDVALEGDWNRTVATVWTRDGGRSGFSAVARSHPTFKPSLELYLEAAWVGIHCFMRVAGDNVFDEELAAEVLEYVEGRIEVVSSSAKKMTCNSKIKDRFPHEP